MSNINSKNPDFSISISSVEPPTAAQSIYFERFVEKCQKRLNDGCKDIRQVYSINVEGNTTTAYIWHQGTLAVYWLIQAKEADNPPFLEVGHSFYPVPTTEQINAFKKASTHTEKEYLIFLNQIKFTTSLILKLHEKS